MSSARHDQQDRQQDRQQDAVDAAPLRGHRRQHHRKDDAGEAAATALQGDQQKPSSERSAASGQSQASLLTDAKKWFDSSNRDPTTTMDANAMDVDTPFYPHRDSASDEPDVPVLSPPGALSFAPPAASFLPPGMALTRRTTRSSSADDYRSVIDDLTIENKRLKEELKRYKQNASRDVLEREKLFEIKVHGLPRRKKQELEATLRDFAASLNDSASSGSASQRQRDKTSLSSKRLTSHGHHHNHPHHHGHHHNDTLYSSNGSYSKHASNSSSSRSRPVDSAYASMSVGAHSSGTSLVRPSFGGPKARTTEQKVEHYLQDIPEGLHPNYGFSALSDKDKKKLIVRRLEQLFTGKIGGRYARRNRTIAPPQPPATTDAAAATTAIVAPPDASVQATLSTGPAREAPIQLRLNSNTKGGSRDNLSTSNSNSNGDDAGHGNGSGSGHGSGNGNGNGNGHGHGHGKAPGAAALPEQRPTRPLDLDPDRVQVPAENMNYIRHLGLVPPEIGPHTAATTIDVSPDADGWVYLNLLANLAQVHIFNVAPDFIRKAVVEKSTKFQLSPDGQKIRWRGGVDGTKFSSDGSSVDHSGQSPSSDDNDGLEGQSQRKRTKLLKNGAASVPSSGKKRSRFGPQESNASSSFHYKPLFVHRSVSPVQTVESDSATQESDPAVGASRRHGKRSSTGNSPSQSHSHSHSHRGSNRHSDSRGKSRPSRYDGSPSDPSQNHSRRNRDGVVVYYSGMPFCTDLAGDHSSGDTSPTTYLTSTGGQAQESIDGTAQSNGDLQMVMHRSSSGSLLPLRPLTDCATLSRAEWSALGLPNGGPGHFLSGSPIEADSASITTASYSYSGGTTSHDDNDDAAADDDNDLEVVDNRSQTDLSPDTADTEEPFLEASGMNRVFPEDHFAVRVTTKRPFRQNFSDGENGGAGSGGDDGEAEDGDSGSKRSDDAGVFSMSTLMKRLAALKDPSAPISGAIAHRDNNRAGSGSGRSSGSGSGSGSSNNSGKNHSSTSSWPPVTIQYVDTQVLRREPVSLPRPALFYSPLSQSSGSDDDDDEDVLLETEGDEDEDESMLASSSEEMISRRANPHHSDNNPSASHASGEDPNGTVHGLSADGHAVDHNLLLSTASLQDVSSGEDGDVEAGDDSGLNEMDADSSGD